MENNCFLIILHVWVIWLHILVAQEISIMVELHMCAHGMFVEVRSKQLGDYF
jgi:hypothetical protein